MVGGILQRITGIGFASASAPAMILLLGPVVGVQMLNGLAAACALVLLIALRKLIDLRRATLLTLTALATTPIGALLAVTMPAVALQILTGVLMLAALFTVRILARWRFIGTPLGAAATGAIGGMANAAVGQAGPFVSAYALASRWEFTSYVASMQLCWFLVNTVAAVIKGIPPVQPLVAIVLSASLGAGLLIGLPIARVVPRSMAARTLLVVAIAGSILVIVKAWLGFFEF
jgi:uncharacterized membrane protein YfcA